LLPENLQFDLFEDLVTKKLTNNLQVKEDGTLVVKDVFLFKASKNISYYCAKLSFVDVAQSYHHLTYDEEAQRRLKDGEPFIKDSQLKEFMEVLRNGEDIIGNIVWNMRTEEHSEPKFDYDESSRTLEIKPAQKIYITDGYHRTKACQTLLEEYKNLGDAPYAHFLVQIHFLSTKKEKDRFGKINHNTNQLSHSKRKRVLDDHRSDFVGDLIENTFLKGKIETDIDTLSLNKLYTFNQLYNALFGHKGIFKYYKLDDESKYNDLLQYLSNFFNYLPKVRKEFNFRNEDEKRQYLSKNLVLEPIMLYAYMTLAREMMNEGYNFEFIDKFFKLKLLCSGKEVWFFNKNSKLWVGKILYDNGNSISGYPPQTSLIDSTANAIRMIG
jgi:hypothetical protein